MICNEDKIIDRFGHWPTFHDAKIMRAEFISEKGDEPRLEIEIHVFELTDQTDENGYFKTKNDTLATIRFDGVRIDQWKWSSGLDTIFELKINKVSGVDAKTYTYAVELPSVIGGDFGLWLTCKAVTIIKAVEYNNNS